MADQGEWGSDGTCPTTPRTSFSIARVLIAVVAIVFVMALLLYLESPRSRRAAPRLQCLNNLKNIGLALCNYEQANGHFPPAYVADKNGRPLLSWRVLLLPYLDQVQLFRQFRLDEPWDSPHNKPLSDLAIREYSCPSDQHEPTAITNYVAIVGPHTAFPGATSIRLSDITDGPENTLLVVEVKNSDIHWAEPRDLHVLQMARSVNAPTGQGISSSHKGGVNVVLCDGSGRSVSDSLSEETLRRLIEIDDGEEVGKSSKRRMRFPFQAPEHVVGASLRGWKD